MVGAAGSNPAAPTNLMLMLPCLEIEPESAAQATVIWLHGLGASGHDFAPIVPDLDLPQTIRFIFPHAPSRPVTINNSIVMPAWYDIVEISTEHVDEAGISESVKAVQALIDQEIKRGIHSTKIVIAGFSQGGAVAYQAALTYSQPLAGLLALSTYFATYRSFIPHLANRRLPVQIFHGTMDPIVPESLGAHAYATLQTQGYNVDYKTYPMQHQIGTEETADIADWLKNLL